MQDRLLRTRVGEAHPDELDRREGIFRRTPRERTPGLRQCGKRGHVDEELPLLGETRRDLNQLLRHHALCLQQRHDGGNVEGNVDCPRLQRSQEREHGNDDAGDCHTPCRTFVPDPDFAAGYFAHVMDWADLDGDGDLDIVTATYDYLLAKEFGGFIPGGGVAYYENRGAGLLPALLTSGADALAVLVADLDGDGKQEIIVGNDYARPDYIFSRTTDAPPPGWAEIAPLAATPTNTMSYDAGGVDNDGQFELFAADMKPYRDDAETHAAWTDLTGGLPPDAVQTDANVLLAAGADGSYRDRALAAGVDATGWSWSAKFGDLDNDGNLDLYVVNGVITVEVFSHLPGDELVEENQALRGDGAGGFAVVPQWGLGSTRSGRGMSMADLDGDGDLDIVVSNMRAPSQVFENRLCGGAGLLVDLRLPDSANTHAIGARAVLVTAAGVRQSRVVRAQSGYLSGDTSRLHFGIPAGDAPARLEITWPDGLRSVVTEIAAAARLEVTRP